MTLLLLWLSAAVTFAESVTAAGGHELTSEDVSAFLDGTMTTGLTTADMPGAVIVVVKGGEILAARGYGFADIATGRKAHPQQTLFRIASITKLFTWTAVMQLVEQGKLDLDRDINHYLDFKIPATFAAPITLRHLMTHTGGFEDSQKGMFREDAARLKPLGQALQEYMPARIFEPGRIVAYSNYSTALAGYIVQRVSGEPFERYAERHIFSPLGMNDTTLSQPLPARLKDRLAEAYFTASAPARPIDYLQPWPCGSAVSSGVDMARFMIAHLQGGEYRGARILQPQTAAVMHEHAIDIAPRHALNAWTLGFWEESRNGRRVISHGGNINSFHSYLNLLPQEGVGMFMIFNGSGTANHYALRFALFRGFMDRYFPHPVELLQPATATADVHGRELAGIYVGSRRSESGFMQLANLFDQHRAAVQPDGSLQFEALRNLGGSVISWREVAPYRWQGINSSATLIGVRDADGGIAYLTTDQVPATSVYQPVPWWRSKQWNMPLLIAACVTLAIAGVASLVRAALGRARRSSPTLSAEKASHEGLSAATCALSFGVLMAWLFIVLRLDVTAFNEALDPWLRLLQVAAALSVAGTALMVWRGIQLFRAGNAGWLAKLESAVATTACLAALWFVFAFNLFSWKLRY